MTRTSVSLLDRLKIDQADASDWRRLNDIYLPLIRIWLAQVPGLDDEAADLAQEVLIVVVRELPAFQRQREGSFRAWLRRVTVNRVRTFLKQRRRRRIVAEATDSFLGQLEDPTSILAIEWDRRHDQHVFDKLSAAIRSDFAATTWAAFQRFAVEGKPAATVAAELGISENAVLLAKSRILKRLRAEARGLVD